MQKTEITVAAAWVVERLSGLGAPVFWEEAPGEAPPPYCVFMVGSLGQDVVVQGDRICSRFDLVCRVISKGADPTPIEGLAELMDNRLEGRSGPVTGGDVFQCRRLRPLAYFERTDLGETYCHLGGTYRLTVRREADA